MNVPDNPYSRRAIAILRDRDIRALRMQEEKPAFLVDNEIALVTYDEDELFGRSDLHPLVRDLQAQDLFRPGNVLVQDPFDLDSYREKSAALEDLSLQKHYLFLELCQILGATKVEASQVTVVDEKSGLRLSSDGSALGASVEASAALKLQSNIQSKLEVSSIFKGSDPDIETAKKFLVRYKLGADFNFSNLVRLRSNPANMVKERRVKLDASSEAKRNIDVAMRVDSAVFSGGASVSSDNSSSYSVELSLLVVF